MFIVPILMLIFAIVFLALVIILIRNAKKREDEIRTDGLEAESVVSRIESYQRDGDIKYRCYVKFIADDGAEHEGLLNVASNLPVGRKIQIKYLPGKYDQVVFVSQELD